MGHIMVRAKLSTAIVGVALNVTSIDQDLVFRFCACVGRCLKKECVSVC